MEEQEDGAGGRAVLLLLSFPSKAGGGEAGTFQMPFSHSCFCCGSTDRDNHAEFRGISQHQLLCTTP